MHSIPSILPSLYDWGFWVPFFFRLFLAYQILAKARLFFTAKESTLIPVDEGTTPSTRKALGSILAVVGLLLFVGLGVQIVAVFFACASLYLFFRTTKHPEGKGMLQLVLLFFALLSFSLLFLGPGPYAIDLPL